MRNRKYIIFFILVIQLSILFCDIQIDRINTFARAQNYKTYYVIYSDQNYIYALTSHGIEIYSNTNSGSLTLISVFDYGSSSRYAVVDDFLYISNRRDTDFYDIQSLKLIQIDISDIENPYQSNELDFGNDLSTFFELSYYRNYLLLQCEYFNSFYTIPDLSYISDFPTSNKIHKINELTAVSEQTLNDFNILNVTDPVNIQSIGTVNFTTYHGNSRVKYFQTYNDSIVFAASQSAVSVWNICDIENWEYISHYQILGNDLHISCEFGISENHLILPTLSGIEMIDISELENLVLEDIADIYFDIFSNFPITVKDNNIYIATHNNGIVHYKINNRRLIYIDSYFKYKRLFNGFRFNNYLYVKSLDDIYLFDISDPYNPIQLELYIPKSIESFITICENRFIIKSAEEDIFYVYEIDNPLSPFLRNRIVINNHSDFLYSESHFNPQNNNSVYLYNSEEDLLSKFDISNPGYGELCYEYYDIDNRHFEISGNYLYILNHNNNIQDLIIIGGLEENNPQYVNTIQNVSNLNFEPNLAISENILCIHALNFNPNNYTHIYDLNNPEIPNLEHILNIPSFSEPIIRDDLLFTRTMTNSYIYELNDPDLYIDYEGCFKTYDHLYSLVFPDCDDNIFYSIEYSDIGLYEYSISISDENELPGLNLQLKNYPNPFNPLTTITFEIPDPGKAQLNIYNVKGQKINQLMNGLIDMGSHNLVWDGTDSNNNPVESGIYLYQLKMNNQVIDSKKCILLK